MANPPPKLAGTLLLTAGLIFCVAAVIGGFVAEQPIFFSFFGVGAAFLGIGAVFFSKSKTP